MLALTETRHALDSRLLPRAGVRLVGRQALAGSLASRCAWLVTSHGSARIRGCASERVEGVGRVVQRPGQDTAELTRVFGG